MDAERGRTATAPRPERPRANRRRPRRAAGRQYSRFVGAMRLLLPIFAGSLIALVIAWPQFQDEQGKTFALNNAAKLDVIDQTGQRLTQAKFTGVDNSNQPYTVTADTVAQASNETDLIDLSNPQADITLNQGAWLTLSAPDGTYSKGDGKLNLSGGVNIFHDQGYEFYSPAATIELKQNLAYGDERVEGHGPFGEVEATGFRISDQGKKLYFKGKTRLLLYPSAKKAAQ